MQIARSAAPFLIAGWASSLRGLWRGRAPATMWQALRLGLCPVDLWRWAEFPAVLEAYRGEPWALDIASPKLLSGLLNRKGCRVIASDIVGQFRMEMPLYQKSGAVAGIQCDAAMLPLADSSVPFLYSVSVVEHMGKGTDAKAMEEMRRVLCPGGRAVVTVPVAPEYAEQWHEADPYGRQGRDPSGRVYFGCNYDRAALHQRVIEPAGMRLVSAKVWQENPPNYYLGPYLTWTSRPRSPRTVAVKLLDPLWAARHIQRVPQGLEALSAYGVAALVFQKD